MQSQTVFDFYSRLSHVHINTRTVKMVSEECMLKGIVKASATQQYAFSMCNPPFFSTEGERLGESASGQGKRPPPSTFSQGTTAEVVTGGGEVGFVWRMIEDSLEVRGQIRWVDFPQRQQFFLKNSCLAGGIPACWGRSQV